MRETELTSKLASVLRTRLPGAIVFKHTEMFVSGIPDLSVSWYKMTSWLEVKLLRGSEQLIQDRGIQRFNVMALSAHGHARYVVYRACDGTRTSVAIVHPDDIDLPQTFRWVSTDTHGYVADQVRTAHRARGWSR